MSEFERLETPFQWLPPLDGNSWIEYVDIKTVVYPSNFAIWDNQYQAKSLYFYWIEDNPPRKIANHIRLNFYHQRVYPVPGSRPIGLYIWGPNTIFLSGKAEIGSPGLSEEVSAVLTRIEQKIDQMR
ncbi:MAG: hypothetical protein ACFB4J_02590 [Elainellaceae cyanobacterium]